MGGLAKLAKFSALAACAAGMVKCVAFVAGLPPGHAGFALAPGQSATAIGLDALGYVTDIFGVPRSGVEVSVLAPEGSSFVFAGGARGKTSPIRLGTNQRASYLFKVSPDADPDEVSEHQVSFGSWSLKAGFSPLSGDSDGPASNASWLIREERSGKYTNYKLDGALYRYALAPGQREARLQVPFVPVRDGADPYKALWRADSELGRAASPVKVALDAPPGMSFGFPGGKRAKSYEFEIAPGASKNMVFDLVAENGWTQKVTLGFALAPAPATQAQAKAAAPRM